MTFRKEAPHHFLLFHVPNQKLFVEEYVTKALSLPNVTNLLLVE